MKIKFVSVDFQKDFTAEGGVCYKPRPSVDFIKAKLAPFLKERNIKIAEIVSDYRQPRIGDRGDCCRPGEWGYESEISSDIKEKDIWIKCMTSPIWVRENLGNPDKKPGEPYQDPEKFNNWIKKVIGRPKEVQIILFGLTLDCCVLCVAQEFDFRGYGVKILNEAVDVYSGNQDEKKNLFGNQVLNWWAKKISWSGLRKKL